MSSLRRWQTLALKHWSEWWQRPKLLAFLKQLQVELQRCWKNACKNACSRWTLQEALEAKMIEQAQQGELIRCRWASTSWHNSSRWQNASRRACIPYIGGHGPPEAASSMRSFLSPMDISLISHLQCTSRLQRVTLQPGTTDESRQGNTSQSMQRGKRAKQVGRSQVASIAGIADTSECTVIWVQLLSLPHHHPLLLSALLPGVQGRAWWRQSSKAFGGCSCKPLQKDHFDRYFCHGSYAAMILALCKGFSVHF